MRTNIEIDDGLLEAARAILGTRTKRETVEQALERVVQREEQRKAFERLRGIGWIGDLEADRADRLL